MWSFPALGSLIHTQTSKLLEKAAGGNVAHVRRLYHSQNPSDDDIRGRGSQD